MPRPPPAAAAGSWFHSLVMRRKSSRRCALVCERLRCETLFVFFSILPVANGLMRQVWGRDIPTAGSKRKRLTIQAPVLRSCCPRRCRAPSTSHPRRRPPGSATRRPLRLSKLEGICRARARATRNSGAKCPAPTNANSLELTCSPAPLTPCFQANGVAVTSCRGLLTAR